MEIRNPKHILVISSPGVSTQPVLHALTKTVPPSPEDRQASSSEPAAATEPLVHRISNSYYSASVPIWQDEVLDANDWAQQWKADEGAQDVIRAVGAWVVAFHKPDGEAAKTALTSLLTNISSVVNTQSSSSISYESLDPDALLLAVSVPKGPPKSTASAVPSDRHPPADLDLDLDLEIDDICLGAGNWEYIDGTLPHSSTTVNDASIASTSTSSPLNEFGERTGMSRLLEALQSGEWEAAENDQDVDLVAAFADIDETVGESGHEHEAAKPAFGDVADDGFGELLAADPDARAELLPKRNNVDEHGEEGDDGGDGNDNNDLDGHAEDETWRVRGNAPPNREARGRSLETDEWATDDDVESLQKMMLRLQAARDLGADLPMGERRRVAALAVSEVMKEIK